MIRQSKIEATTARILEGSKQKKAQGVSTCERLGISSYKLNKLDKLGELPFSGYKHIGGHYGSRWVRVWTIKRLELYAKKEK